MDSIGMHLKKRMQATSISASDNRCPTCSRKLLLEDGKETCFYCQSVAKEDKQISNEVTEWVRNREVNELLNTFKEKSLMNRDLENATLDNYQPQNESQAQALQLTRDYIESFDGTTGLIYTGRPGLGKSHLVAGMTKEIMQKKHTCIFISLPRLFSELKDTYNKNSSKTELSILNALQKVDLLVLDDLGAEREEDKEATTWARTKIFEIVDSRIGKSTVYTTNHAGGVLLKMYGERDFSRMIQNCKPVKMDGENYRLQAFK
ncbi:ATP-binding protein [Rossellomorea vietnamensis]|uniref:ATP-binding protein n=1 Tax=Rossellomorea vietnamensis TaxID=218284 RepID=A0A5D4KE21_9BACI|nr:ATP-binding protein [Rossellomorea vietnamensis]TYR75558.1 ATP-binding protein [Rossellomorea vietnamensis]